MTRIYVIRHAEAEGNIKRIFQGCYDADISPNGERQLEQLRERCRPLPFSAVYSSPLLRALKTARAADFYHRLPITTLDGLIEINGGIWEGLPWESLPERYPEQNRLWVSEPWKFDIEGGESMRSVYDRMRETVTGIVRKHPGQTVCAVSHGCAIRNLLCWALGKPFEELNDVGWCDNTAVSVIDFDEKLRPHVLLLNDASHLDEETSTLNKQDWWRIKPVQGENL